MVIIIVIFTVMSTLTTNEKLIKETRPSGRSGNFYALENVQTYAPPGSHKRWKEECPSL